MQVRTVAAGAVAILDITDTTSPNAQTLADDILVPEAGKLSQGEGVRLRIGTGRDTEVREIIYGGFLETASLNANAIFTGAFPDTYNIQLRVIENCSDLADNTFSITTTTTMTNLQVMEQIRDAINAPLPSQISTTATARVEVTGSTAALYIGPKNSNHGLVINDSSGAGLFITSGLNFASVRVDEFYGNSSDYAIGRFSNLRSLEQAFIEAGFPNSAILESISNGGIPAIGTTILLDTTPQDGQVAQVVEFVNTNGSVNSLRLFGLEAGYPKALYNPYDSDNNMAGGNDGYRTQKTVSVTIYDSQGTKHTVLAGFLKLSTNEWAYELFAKDPTEVTNRADGLLQAGTLLFDHNGALDDIRGTKQIVDSKSISSPEQPLYLDQHSDNPILDIEVGIPGASSTYTYTYHKKIMELGDDLVLNTNTITLPTYEMAKALVINVDGAEYQFAKSETANDLEALQSVAASINASTAAGLKAYIISKGMDNYHLAIKAQDPMVAFSVMGGALQGVLRHTLEDNVPENSFTRYSELSTLINSSNQAQQIQASIIRDGYNYKLRISPEKAEQFLAFKGEELVDALELTNTGADGQIISPNDDITINWAARFGESANTISIDLNGDGSIAGISQIDAEYSKGNVLQNGVEAGKAISLSIDKAGEVILEFSNGVYNITSKIPVVTYILPPKLTDIGNGVSLVPKESEAVLNIKQAGSHGTGVILPENAESKLSDLSEACFIGWSIELNENSDAASIKHIDDCPENHALLSVFRADQQEHINLEPVHTERIPSSEDFSEYIATHDTIA